MAGHLVRRDAGVKKVRPYDLVALLALVLTLVVFMYAGYFTREYTVNVTRVESAYPYQMYTSMDTGGRVVVGRKSSISPRVPGELAQVLVDKGSLVKKGQLIARLENTEAMLDLEQARADLRLAHANLEQAGLALNEAGTSFEHDKGLRAKGDLADADLRASEMQLRKAGTAMNVAQATVNAREAALRRAELILGYTSIHAPFDGIVLSRKAHAGDMVRPLASDGDEAGGIVTLADLSALVVEVRVPGAELETIRAGQPCEIILDLSRKPFRGEVDAIVPLTGREGRDAVVRVGFLDRDARIMPDMNARVAFLVRPISSKEDKPLVAVDRSALTPVRGGYSVFKVSGDRAVEKAVRLGRQFKDKVEVIEGIALGDALVANPPDGLRHGSKVLVRSE